MFKDDSYGLDLIQDIGQNGILMHKFLAKHSFILRGIYSFVNEMKFWNISNLLRTAGEKYSMYAIIDILDRNWVEFEYWVRDSPPNWG